MKSLKKNYFYNVLYQVLVIILPIITTPYISRVLGATNIGIYSFTLSITTYFILFGSLGTSLYGQREIAYVQDDKYKRSKVFIEIFLLRLITMLISMFIFYFVFVNSKNDYKIYYTVLFLELVASVFDISWFYQGLEEFKKIVIRNTIVKIISIISIFIFVKNQNDLLKYFIIYVLSNLFGNLSLWINLKKYIGKIDLKQINVFKHLKPTLVLFLPQIAVQIYTVLDKTMIGAIIVDKSETGFYDQSQKIVKILLATITSLGTVMLPRISNKFSKKEYEAIEKYVYKSFNVVIMLALPLIIGLCVCIDRFVPIFFGNGYEKVSILIKIISPILLLIGLSNVIGYQYLLPMKKQKQYTISVITGAITNLLVNLLLIPRFGAVGASIGTVMAEFIVTLVMLLFVKDNFKIYMLLMYFIKYLLVALIMGIICYGLSFIPLKSIYIIILQILVGSISYFGILLLLKDSIIINIFNVIIEKMIKNKK